MNYVTGTATMDVPPTLRECEDEIIYFAIALMECRWYQDKSHKKHMLKYWIKKYYEALGTKN